MLFDGAVAVLCKQQHPSPGSKESRTLGLTHGIVTCDTCVCDGLCHMSQEASSSSSRALLISSNAKYPTNDDDDDLPTPAYRGVSCGCSIHTVSSIHNKVAYV